MNAFISLKAKKNRKIVAYALNYVKNAIHVYKKQIVSLKNIVLVKNKWTQNVVRSPRIHNLHCFVANTFLPRDNFIKQCDCPWVCI